MKILAATTLALSFIIPPSSGLVPRASFEVDFRKANQLINSSPVIKAHTSPLFHPPKAFGESTCLRSSGKHANEGSGNVSALKRVLNRLDTISSAGLPESTLVSGLFRRVTKLHNPITYLILALIAGLRLEWCFRNPYYWFAVAFCIKWYRAKYVFKIPVWDRQPNWNNIITSKEQEKDLKAFTCKNCGSTLFIAKTREFFFEGDTGIGGLGCFSCGAKGKDNFVMDRDRIVEDVADMDDYFDYERPLDFVSRAERRALLKEAAGDEELANKLLVERTSDSTEVNNSEESVPAKDEKSGDSGDDDVLDVAAEVEDSADASSEEEKSQDKVAAAEDEGETSEKKTKEVASKDIAQESDEEPEEDGPKEAIVSDAEVIKEAPKMDDPVKKEKKSKPSKPKQKKSSDKEKPKTPPASSSKDDILDFLDMDDF